jgi:hypothetical protein
MALSKGMTALRAALGAVGGGLEGYTQMRALEQKRQQEQEAMRRQSMMDTLSLVQAGAMPTAQRRAVAQEGTSAIGSAITSAMNVAGGGPAIPFDAGAIQRGAGRLGAPAAQVTLGGTTYDIPSMQDREAMALAGALSRKRAEMGLETEQRLGLAQEQARASAAAEQQQIDAYIAAGATPAQARAAVKAKAGYGDVFVTPGQQLTAATTRRGQDITARGQQLSYDAAMARVEQEKAAGGKTPASEIEKRLPVGARNDIADYNAAIRTLQEAKAEVEKNPGAFGLGPKAYSYFGAPGREMRAWQEGEKSEAYTRARAQLQSSLMKLRKTQFGTQMTKLEQATGEEVFPSGAEKSDRLIPMIDVLLGNAEQLRRGVYDANNASDLYQPIAPAEKAPPATPTPSQPTMTLDQWMDANPQRPGETDAQYEARYRASARGGR